MSPLTKLPSKSRHEKVSLTLYLRSTRRNFAEYLDQRRRAVHSWPQTCAILQEAVR